MFLLWGAIIGLYVAFSLKIVDVTSFVEGDLDYAEPHPFRWIYGGLILCVTVGMGFLLVAVSELLEGGASRRDYSIPEQTKAPSFDQFNR